MDQTPPPATSDVVASLLERYPDVEALVRQPPGQREAVAWLLGRHPYLDTLMRRFDPEPVQAVMDLPGIMAARQAHEAAWTEYAETHPEPRSDADDAQYDAWQEAGPRSTDERVEYLGVLSGGERRIVRALAFLTGRVTAGVTDLYGIDLPGSQTDFWDDWLACVRVGIDRW